MAFITAGGFAAAVVQLRNNLRDSRSAREQDRQEEEENREAMARAVGLKSTWQPGEDSGPPEGHDGLMPVEIEILNSSPYPIREAMLELPTDDEEHPMSIVYGTILPGEHRKDTYEVPRTEVEFGELMGGATLLFTDTYGSHWSSSTSWRGLERREQAARIC